MKNLLKIISFCTLFCSTSLFAQPVNDNCSNAEVLTVGTDCELLEYTSVGATEEGPSAAEDPNCGFYQGGDVWFSFEVPASGNFRVDVSGNFWVLYTGSCGNFSELNCDNNPVNYVRPDLASSELYIRAFRFNNASGSDFDICVYEITPPENDNCADATELTVGSSCVEADFSTKESTAEDPSIAADPSCGFYQGGDTWYAFDVPASGNFRIDISGNFWVLYTGSCGSFSEVNCGNEPVNYIRPDLAGQTLYIRAYRFNSAQGSDGSICVFEITPAENDNCSDATELTLGSTCVEVDFSTEESTAEDPSIAADPSCGFYQGGDVWFEFDVPASGNFRVDISGNFWVLYSGTCGNFSEINCSDDPVNYARPDLAGQTLYIRSFRFNSAQGNDGSICVFEITSPSNDNCSDATVLALNQECTPEDYSNKLSTAEEESVVPDPTCGFYQGGDTWFVFDAPASGQFRIDISSTNWSLYQGSCGNFTELICDNAPMNFNDPNLGGETLYLRTFRFNSPQGTDFTLCIREIEAAANDNCADATEIAFSDTCLAEAFSSQLATAEEENIAEDPSCGFFNGGDVWFKFQAPPIGQFTVNRPTGTQQFAFYTGDCGDFTEIFCDGDDELVFDDPSLGGEIIFIRAFRFNNRQGSDFELCVLTDELSPNDNCSDAIALNVDPSACNYGYFGSYNATDEEGLASEPSCGQYQGDDVWFNFEVPADGKFAIARENVIGDFSFSLYSGTCENFEELVCIDNAEQEIFDVPTVAGQIIYLRAWNNNSTIGGEFGLCITEVDCNNTIGGTAFVDNCGVCVNGTTGLEECVPDCNGDFGGTAFIDECDQCVGGATGQDACVQDCNGDFGGTAFIDNCDTCVGGETGLEACCANPFPALDESSIATTINSNSVGLEWESIDGQIGCELELRFAGASSNIATRRVAGTDLDSFTIPGFILELNQEYEWRVRCGCSRFPLVASPFSSWQFFSTEVGAHITASPNPVADNATISVTSDFADHATVAVFDLNGRQVAQLYSGEIQAEQTYRFTFDASGLANGVYLCRYTGQSKTTITKIMVAR